MPKHKKLDRFVIPDEGFGIFVDEHNALHFVRKEPDGWRYYKGMPSDEIIPIGEDYPLPCEVRVAMEAVRTLI